MLVLSRKRFQSLQIGQDIRITVVKIEGNQVRLGIEAPDGVTILREELVGVPSSSWAIGAGRGVRQELVEIG